MRLLCNCSLLSHFLLLVITISLALSSLEGVHGQSPSLPVLNGQPIQGSVGPNATAYFGFNNQVAGSTVLISVTCSIGFPSLFVSLTSPTPSSSSFDWSASSVTGGVVSVASAAAVPFYLTVQSSPYSPTNFTLTVLAYDPAIQQSMVVPLSEAIPQSSAAGAGEYRYYSYVSPFNAPRFMVTDVEQLGGAELFINGPNVNALPTTSSYQYNTLASELEVIIVNSPPAGQYTIGVYANQSTLFTVLAAQSTSIIPMSLGVSYPGQVDAGRLWYYSTYLSAAQTLTPLTFTLYSLTGDADLYCSDVTSTPSYSNFQYGSANSIGPDTVTIPANTLSPGWFYCGVNGYIDAVYTFIAVTPSSSSVSIDDQSIVYQQANAGTNQVFTYNILASSVNLTSSVVFNVVAEYGTVTIGAASYPNVQLGSYGPGSLGYGGPASTQLLRIPFSTNWCNWSIIVGSDPPQCAINIVVTAVTSAVYRVVVMSAAQDTVLLVGQPLLGDVTPQSAAGFTFNVPNSFLNVTVLVAITSGGADGVTVYGSRSGGAVQWV